METENEYGTEWHNQHRMKRSDVKMNGVKGIGIERRERKSERSRRKVQGKAELAFPLRKGMKRSGLVRILLVAARLVMRATTTEGARTLRLQLGLRDLAGGLSVLAQ